MLKTINRLTKNKEFDLAFKQGRSNYNRLFGIKMVDNDKNTVRMGILLGNKVSKKSSDRNKIKRRLREAFRAEMPNLVSGRDFVIVALPEIATNNYATIKDLMQASLKQLSAYKKNV